MGQRSDPKVRRIPVLLSGRSGDVRRPRAGDASPASPYGRLVCRRWLRCEAGCDTLSRVPLDNATRCRSNSCHDRDPPRTDYHEALRTLSEASVDQHFDAFARHRVGRPGVRRRPQRRALGAAGGRRARAAPTGTAPAARGADPGRALPAGQRHQGRAAVRAGADRRADELRVHAAQRHPRVPLRHPRGDRGVPPHPDVPGVREPLGRRGRRRPAAVPCSSGRSCRWPRAGSRSASSSACSRGRSRSTTCRSRSCAREATSTRCSAGSCRSTSPRRRGTSASRTSTSSIGAAAQAATSGSCSRSRSR